jgi:hypothetical protein
MFSHLPQSDGAGATVLLYINGKFLGLGMPPSFLASANHNRQADAYLGVPGTQAMISEFQVVALPRDP